MRAWFLIPFVLGFGLLGFVAFERHKAEKRDLATYQAAVRRAQGPARSGGKRGGKRGGSGRYINPVTLSGPGGKFTIPGDRAMVVNVWLQACPDCMPRFNAARDFVRSGKSWPTPIVNVAYQRGDQDWANRYGVGDGLVIDRGSAIVMPLRITTFTTLVVDREGKVVLTDYIDRPGFLERVEDALARADAPPAAPSPPAPNGTAGVPAAAPTPAPLPPAPPPQPSIFKNPLALGGISLMVIGLLGGLGRLFASGLSSDENSGVIQPWQEDLVVSGRRCASCAGRFDEPTEATRCRACEAPYHHSCAKRERTCATDSCTKRLA